jgi:hypothetical protein
MMQASYRKYQAVGLALILAATIAPVSFAVSLDSSGAAAERGRASIASVASSRADASASAGNTVAFQPGLDAVRLLIVGSVYFGLAALIRRTI